MSLPNNRKCCALPLSVTNSLCLCVMEATLVSLHCYALPILETQVISNMGCCCPFFEVTRMSLTQRIDHVIKGPVTGFSPVLRHKLLYLGVPMTQW